MRITVILPLSFSISTQRLCLAITSSPSVGSSRKSIFGSEISAIAMLNLLTSPPDSFLALRFSNSCMEKRSISSLALAFATFFEKP